MGGYGTWVPRWDIQGESLPHRVDEDSYGPAIGQTCSSTRHEFMGWIAILTKPIRTMYATDSRAMMTKAKQLIEKAKYRDECIRRRRKYKEGCPFKNLWGTQTDGDLWQVAWEAVIVRGSCSQDVRWVKGHATNEDIRQGRSSSSDQKGNDRTDTNADKGVEMVAGEGLVTLAKWAAQRYEGYLKFMAKIHKMIAAVTRSTSTVTTTETERRRFFSHRVVARWPK